MAPVATVSSVAPMAVVFTITRTEAYWAGILAVIVAVVGVVTVIGDLLVSSKDSLAYY